MTRPVERLDTSAMTAAERQQAITEATRKHPAGSKHKARKVDASAAPTRCLTCGHIDTTNDQGQAMDRHIDREHGGLGASSMVITPGVNR